MCIHMGVSLIVVRLSYRWTCNGTYLRGQHCRGTNRRGSMLDVCLCNSDMFKLAAKLLFACTQTKTSMRTLYIECFTVMHCFVVIRYLRHLAVQEDKHEA